MAARVASSRLTSRISARVTSIPQSSTWSASCVLDRLDQRRAVRLHLVELHPADLAADDPRHRGRDGGVHVADPVDGLLGLGDAVEDRDVHRDQHVVRGDGVLLGGGELPLEDRDAVRHPVEERDDEVEARAQHRPQPPEPLDHELLGLRHHADAAEQREDDEERDQDQDDRPAREPAEEVLSVHARPWSRPVAAAQRARRARPTLGPARAPAPSEESHTADAVLQEGHRPLHRHEGLRRHQPPALPLVAHRDPAPRPPRAGARHEEPAHRCPAPWPRGRPAPRATRPPARSSPTSSRVSRRAVSRGRLVPLAPAAGQVPEAGIVDPGNRRAA